MKREWRRCVATAVLVSFVAVHVLPRVLPAATKDVAPSEEQRRQAIAQAVEIERTVRRAEFDPAERAAELGPSIEAAFAFVRDQVRLDLYRGWMKGAAGTLATRSGSALDRSILLSELLAKHGLRTRYATGKLTAKSVRKLVAAQLAPRAAGAHAAVSAATPDCAPTHERYFEEVSAVLAEVERDARQLAASLDKAGVQLRRPVAEELAELEAVAEAHRWVQVEQGGAWVDLDPAFPDAVPGRAFAPVASTSVEPPAEEAHALTFRLRLARMSNGKPEELTLVEGGGRAAELQGLPVRLLLLPDGEMETVSQADVRRATGFLVVLVVAGKTTQRTFAINGQTEKTSGPARTGIFGSSGLLSGLDEAVKASGGTTGRTLDRVWFEIAVREPGRRERVHVRDLYARPAGAEVDPATVALALCREQRFLVEVGPESPERIAGLAAGWLKDHAAGLDRAATDPDAKVSEDGPARPDEALELRALSQISWIAGDQIAIQDFGGARFYRARPAVYAFRLGYEPVDSTRARFRIGYDIIDSAWATWHRTSPDRAAALAMSLGVLQTHLERFYCSKFIERIPDLAPAAIMGMGDLLAAAASRGVALQVVQDPSALERHGVPASARAMARARIERGDVLLMPATPVPVDGRERWGFWQVDPRSGNALGVLDTGEGQATLERLILIATFRTWLFLDNNKVAITIGLTALCLAGFAYALATSSGLIQGSPEFDKASSIACILLEGFFAAGLGSFGRRGGRPPPDQDAPGGAPPVRPPSASVKPFRERLSPKAQQAHDQLKRLGRSDVVEKIEGSVRDGMDIDKANKAFEGKLLDEASFARELATRVKNAEDALEVHSRSIRNLERQTTAAGRPGAKIGDGSTEGAVLGEIRTGLPVGTDAGHHGKAQDVIWSLEGSIAELKKAQRMLDPVKRGRAEGEIAAARARMNKLQNSVNAWKNRSTTNPDVWNPDGTSKLKSGYPPPLPTRKP